MQGVDVARVRYRLVAVDGRGERLVVPWVALSWEENPGELAARLVAEVPNERVHGGWLHERLALGAHVVLYADWGAGWREIFRGTVFRHDYRRDPLGRFEVTAYDMLVYLMRSKDDRLYASGTPARAIIEDIARAWSIPLGRVEGPDTRLARQVFRERRLADMIAEVLEQVRERGGGRWIVRAREGRMEVVRAGGNQPVYRFRADEAVMEVRHARDIEDLVTRVVILGAADEDTRAPVVARMDGRTEFGVLQELVYEERFETPAAARDAARQILAERGRPRDRRVVVAPDLPFLRRGDRVWVEAGTASGYHIVVGVHHDAARRVMEMEVEEDAGG